jgi:predicted nuclease of predicted toxin-antitoxin system
MRVVVDNNLPRSLARLLGQSGIEAAHVLDLGLANVSDRVLRERLAGAPVIFLSRDDDFWVDYPHGWAVVWVALHNPTLAQLKDPIARTLARLIPDLRPGQRVLFAADQVRVFGE